MKANLDLRLPAQSPPVSRELMTGQKHGALAGVEAAQSACDNLPYLARQMCIALEQSSA